MSTLKVNSIEANTGSEIDINSTLGTIPSIIISGVTTVAAGSAAAPSITPTGDSNTGIFFPSADTIAFGEGGAEALRIDSSGRVGIGTTSPTEKLYVEGGIKGTYFTSGLAGATASLTNGSSENIITFTSNNNYQLYIFSVRAVNNTSVSGVAFVYINGAANPIVNNISLSAGVSFTVSGTTLRVTCSTATDSFNWRAIRLADLN